jgi:hypothetical protein
MKTDFSILLEPVQTTADKRDISIVTGYNAFVQNIEHVLKTQKNEIVSNMNLGSDLYSFIFGSADIPVLEFRLAAYIRAAVPKLSNVQVKLLTQTSTYLTFQIFFSFYDGIKIQDNLSCNIEVSI